MQFKPLTLASLTVSPGMTGAAFDARAMFLNPNDLGEALIYAYYTVNGGNANAVLAKYTTLYRHKFHSTCLNSAQPCS